MTIPTNATVLDWGDGKFPLGVQHSAIGFDYSPSGGDLSQFFPAEMPRRNTDDGCIIQNDFYYTQGVSSKIPNEQAFADVPIGTKPSDWDTHFFDYYKIITMGNYTVFDSVANQGLNYTDSPPTWDSTAAYYHDDLPIKSRFTQLFTTAAGITFKIGISTNTTWSYNRWECNINGNSAYGSADQVSAPHYSGIPAGGLGYDSKISFPNKLPNNPNDKDRPTNILQIFVHTVYNDIDYYGYGVIRMSTISESAYPTEANFCLFTVDFWGDSIQGGTPSQGGEWGASTQRAGGQGVHTASSDARGDRAGTTVRDIMINRDNALALAFDTPFMRTYSFDNLTTTQIAEIFAILYGTDYWSMFQNQMLNPLSSIVAFHLIPSTLRGANLTLEDLIIGPKNISAAMTGRPQVTKIKQINWYHVGTVDMSDVLLPYFDAYPDFAPYTDIILHLPYIGDIKIDVNAVMYGALSVEYVCDNVSGNVAAWIYCEDRYPDPQTHKQYKYIATGNCAYSIPLFAQSQSGLDVGKIIGSGIGIVGGALTGNLAAAASGMLGIGSALYEHSRAPISTQTTGGSSGNVSILGDSDVWIEVIRPQWIQPESYQQLVGIPSGISGTLSEIGASGRVVCSDIETDGIAATEPELREIERLLLSGIYLKPQA